MIEQGTEAWKLQRLGKLTASRVAEAIYKTKSGWGATRANLMATLIAERLTGVAVEGYTSPAMEWGIEKEAAARAAYAFYTGQDVVEVGFIPHPTIEMSGASPDGLVGEHGLVELKCPLTASHIETLLGAGIPDKYVVQTLWQMECTGRLWCDLVSFDPRMPEELRLVVRRVNRDEVRLTELRRDVRQFLDELATKEAALRALAQADKAA